jgi:DNA-binding transcriptional regulator YbjK
MLIPYLCEVEVDVTFEQFEEMLKSTNKNFLSFVEVILNLINDGISMASSVEKIESVTKSITEKTNIIVETDEDKLQRLYNEYGEAKNRYEKRRLMREIESLEEKIDKNAN